MKRFKILYMSDSGSWGGAQKVTLTLIKGLKREQYELHYILGSDGLFAQALQAEGVSVHFVPMIPMSIPPSQRYLLPFLLILFLGRLIRYSWKTYRTVRRIQPDLIQTCSIQAKLIGSIVARLSRTKLLWHVQNIQPVGFRRHTVRFMARYFPDKIVATSHAVAAIYADVVSADKLCVNHAGVDLAEFAAVDRRLARRSVEQELGLTQQKIVVFASMLRYWKAPHLLLEAAAEVLKKQPAIIFLLVGESQFTRDNAYKQELLKLIDRLGLHEKVRLLGFKADVYRFIAAGDCLVHCPIHDDPLPTVVLEAMALKTPVIGAAIGGITEEIEDQKTGLLFEPGNSPELAKAIIQLLDNPGKAECFAQAARHKLEAEFSYQQFVQNFHTTYAQLIR